MERMIKLMYVIAFFCLTIGMPVAMYMDVKTGASHSLQFPRHPW
jgi:hypothetical protein